jgi:hypothetical protein
LLGANAIIFNIVPLVNPRKIHKGYNETHTQFKEIEMDTILNFVKANQATLIKVGIIAGAATIGAIVAAVGVKMYDANSIAVVVEAAQEIADSASTIVE